jgi:DNA polymerase eta
VPTTAPNGLDTVLPPPPPISWDNRGILIPIDPPSENQAGSSSSHGPGTHAGAEDGDDDDDDDPRRTWHDVALSIAAEFMDKIRAQVRLQLGYTTSAVGISLRFGCYETLVDPLSPWLQGIARNKFLAKVRRLSIHNAFTGCSCKATHSSPRRTKSGTRRLSRSDLLHIVGLTFTQSILRNAAIPNYLIPMPFQKVTRV